MPQGNDDRGSGVDVIELTSRLVAIDSQNPGPGEREIAGFVRDWARERGLETTTLEPVAGRPNLVVTLDGGGPGHLGLSGHLDTKPVGDALAQWHTPPLELTVDGDLGYGLGTTDMKGAVAAMLVALDRLAAASASGRSRRGRTSVVLTADEEHGSDAGAKALATGGRLPGPLADVEALIIGEPSGISEPWQAVHLVSRGICCFEVEVRTHQGHSGLSDVLGPNAVLVAADLLRAFETFVPHVAHPGRVPCTPTVNPGILVEGGVGYGTWPGRCVVGIEIRLVPGMDRDELDGELRAAIGATIGDRCEWDLRYVPTSQGWMPPVELSPDAPVARAARAAAARVLGREVPVAAFPGSTDATYFMGEAGVPTITSLGPGWLTCAHGADERVGIRQLDEAVDIYATTVDLYFAEREEGRP